VAPLPVDRKERVEADGVVIWEEARLDKAVELCQAFIELLPEQLKTLGSDPVTTL